MNEPTDKQMLDWIATHSIETDGRPYISITREMIKEGMEDHETRTVQPESAAETEGGDGQ